MVASEPIKDNLTIELFWGNIPQLLAVNCFYTKNYHSCVTVSQELLCTLNWNTPWNYNTNYYSSMNTHSNTAISLKAVV